MAGGWELWEEPVSIRIQLEIYCRKDKWRSHWWEHVVS